MKKLLHVLYAAITGISLSSCDRPKQAVYPAADSTQLTISNAGNLNFTSGYATVNGLRMYYEVYGEGQPLVLLHGGGSTIQTSFGRIIPALVRSRKVIAVELQAHGRTGDRPGEISFTQDADDVAALLRQLSVRDADIFGFSNGANTALQMAIRHPSSCRRIVAGSPLLKRAGALPQFWEFMKTGTFAQMPDAYKQEFMKLNHDSAKLLNMYTKCANRMINFPEFTDAEIAKIHAPVLLINGNHDVATSEHVVALSKQIPHCTLLIVPGGHGAYIGEITTLKPGFRESDFAVSYIEQFLDSPDEAK